MDSNVKFLTYHSWSWTESLFQSCLIIFKIMFLILVVFHTNYTMFSIFILSLSPFLYRNPMFEGNQQQDAHEVMKIQFCRDNFILYSFEKKKISFGILASDCFADHFKRHQNSKSNTTYQPRRTSRGK